MAKKSKIEHNLRRKSMVDRYADRRTKLKAVISDPNTPDEERFEAVRALDRLPRNSSRTRVRNRCRVTGRPRAFYRKFEISRVAMRDLGLSGQIAGLKKASW
ncbi:MAG: 30S ribosomal protein S14 [Myxococcales bacterium]|nr:30S ribosomal protein S14 [Myxococcales bacterium]